MSRSFDMITPSSCRNRKTLPKRPYTLSRYVEDYPREPAAKVQSYRCMSFVKAAPTPLQPQRIPEPGTENSQKTFRATLEACFLEPAPLQTRLTPNTALPKGARPRPLNSQLMGPDAAVKALHFALPGPRANRVLAQIKVQVLQGGQGFQTI